MVHEELRRARAWAYRAKYFDEMRTHPEMTLQYLSINKSITDGEARIAFGCSRLASVICRLRKKGYPIVSVFEDGNKFCTYKFSVEDEGVDR